MGDAAQPCCLVCTGAATSATAQPLLTQPNLPPTAGAHKAGQQDLLRQDSPPDGATQKDTVSGAMV
jgi:hypothetical protein